MPLVLDDFITSTLTPPLTLRILPTKPRQHAKRNVSLVTPYASLQSHNLSSDQTRVQDLMWKGCVVASQHNVVGLAKLVVTSLFRLVGN